MIPQVLGHLLSWLLDRKMKDDALSSGSKFEWETVWHLRHSRTFRVLWIWQTGVWAVAASMFVVLPLVGLLEWWYAFAAPVFGVLLAFSFMMARDGITQEIELSEWGITERRRSGRTTAIPWSTVVDVRFVRLLESYRVTSRDGQAIRLSMHIQGMPQFKAFVLRYSPPDAIAGLRARLHKLERL
jgi:hypothetical protein